MDPIKKYAKGISQFGERKTDMRNPGIKKMINR
jgi:hypothetical protein